MIKNKIKVAARAPCGDWGVLVPGRKTREWDMDTLTPEERSEIMSRVKGKDTRPEMVVRRLIHGMGFRYQLHRADLPGKPDIVFPGRRKVIFVHGCFWHRHKNCKLARLPKSRVSFWEKKLEANRVRDTASQKTLNEMGWRTMIIWECEISDAVVLAERLRRFLVDDQEEAEREKH
jgi:DNA mismatch endonuclease, patch repair protein